jgi:DNA-binding NarL/FixJ family response regulator
MVRTTIMLADDHVIVAEGLASLLKESFDLVGVVADGRALLRSAKELQADVIVTDISMPLLNGLDAVRQLRTQGVKSKVIVLTQHKETQLAIEAFAAGVSGYVLKQSAGEELVNAIHEVTQGRVYLTPLIAKDLITVLVQAQAANRDNVKLSTRQREVLQLIAEGKTAKEIAVQLDISTRTAEGHKYGIMQALGVKTTAELVQQAIRLGLISV